MSVSTRRVPRRALGLAGRHAAGHPGAAADVHQEIAMASVQDRWRRKDARTGHLVPTALTGRDCATGPSSVTRPAVR